MLPTTGNFGVTRITKKATRAFKLADVDSKVDEVDVVAIDEGQFFPDIVEFCQKWADQGKTVVVAALDATFERKPFGSICHLIAMAESVRKLTAVCLQCSGEAVFTHKHAGSGEVNDIGGLDKYFPVCRPCFLELNPTEPRGTKSSGSKSTEGVRSVESSP